MLMSSRLKLRSSLLILFLLVGCTQARKLNVDGLYAYVHHIKHHTYVIGYQITMPKNDSLKINQLKVTYMTKLPLDRAHPVKASDRFQIKSQKQAKMTYYYYHGRFSKQERKQLLATRCSYEYLDRRETKQIQKVIIKNDYPSDPSDF